MHATTVAIDLAKDVFELAFADVHGRIVERKRLSRLAFSRCLTNRPTLRVVMEACGSAHHWARVLQAQGIRCACCRRGTCARMCAATRTMMQTIEQHLSAFEKPDRRMQPFRFADDQRSFSSRRAVLARGVHT